MINLTQQVALDVIWLILNIKSEALYFSIHFLVYCGALFMSDYSAELCVVFRLDAGFTSSNIKLLIV